MKCLTDEQIAIYIDGITEDKEYAMIMQHLAECDNCLSRMNEVYTFLNLDKELGGSQKSNMLGMNKVRFLKPRYFISLAVAASLVVISIVVLKETAPVDVLPGSSITEKDEVNETGTVKINEKGIFSVSVKQDIIAEIIKDERTIPSVGISMNTIAMIKGDKATETKMMNTDERLAFEKKILLIRSGYYYFMLKQTRDDVFYEKVKDVMEMAFPDILLKNLSDTSFKDYEKSIAGVSSSDRNNFLKGFFLSYYLYSDGRVDEWSSFVTNAIDSLRNEEVLGINNLFLNKGTEHEKLAADMKHFFMM